MNENYYTVPESKKSKIAGEYLILNLQKEHPDFKHRKQRSFSPSQLRVNIKVESSLVLMPCTIFMSMFLWLNVLVFVRSKESFCTGDAIVFIIKALEVFKMEDSVKTHLETAGKLAIFI